MFQTLYKFLGLVLTLATLPISTLPLKNLTFAQNRARFAPYESKLSYASIPGRSLLPGEDEFKIEAEMRTEVKSHM